jgi:hypothetical protein
MEDDCSILEQKTRIYLKIRLGPIASLFILLYLKDLKKLITAFLSIAALSISMHLRAQSYIGLNNSNYAGVLGATIHPASIEDYEGKFDMVFFGANVFADNNFGRVTRDKAFLNFKFNDFSSSLFRNDKEKYALFNLGVTLPSFMIKTKNWGTIGLISRVRNYANADDVSSDYSRAIADGFANSELFNQNFLNQHFDLTSMSWNEIGVTWAKVIKKNKRKRLTFGVTPKVLIGNGAAFASFQADTLSNAASGIVNIADFNFAYGYSSNLDNVADADYKWKKGNKFNFGLDIGLEYTHYYKNDYQPSFSKYLKLYRTNNNEKNAYKYKLSLSLTDLGRIKYEHGGFNGSASVSLPDINTGGIDVTTLNGTFGDPNVLRDSLNSLIVIENLTGAYTVGLPTMLQAGIDYHIKGGTYINGNMALNLSDLKWSDYTTSDLSNITITPRWENHWLGIHAPVYTNLKGTTNFGLGARIGPLAFGVSDVLPFISKKEVTGGGAYIVFKTFIRHKKEKNNVQCGPGGRWSKKKRKR